MLDLLISQCSLGPARIQLFIPTEKLCNEFVETSQKDIKGNGGERIL